MLTWVDYGDLKWVNVVLQDPQDKKVIVCDEKLKKIFAGKDRVGFLEIAKLIGPHFLWMKLGGEMTINQITSVCFGEVYQDHEIS